MAKRIYIIIIALLMTSLSGCAGSIYTNYRELEQLLVIQAAGFDKSEKGVTVSVSTGKPPEGKKPIHLKAEGDSASIAMDRIQEYSYSEELYYPHTGFILLGEEAAADTAVFLDFFERWTQLRMNTPLICVRGGKAVDLVMGAGGEDSDISEVLSSMERDLKRSGVLKLFTCGETARSLSQNGAALICSVLMAENSGVGEGVTAMESGYAVIKDGEVRGYLDGEGARGVSLLLGSLGSALVELPCGVTVELVRGEAKFSPQWSEAGSLERLDVDVALEGNILELSELKDVTQDELLSTLSAELAKKAMDWAKYTLAASRQYEADFLGLGRKIALSAPQKWEAVAQDWEKLLPELEMRVTAEAKIMRTYELGKPVNNGGVR